MRLISFLPLGRPFPAALVVRAMRCPGCASGYLLLGGPGPGVMPFELVFLGITVGFLGQIRIAHSGDAHAQPAYDLEPPRRARAIRRHLSSTDRTAVDTAVASNDLPPAATV